MLSKITGVIYFFIFSLIVSSPNAAGIGILEAIEKYERRDYIGALNILTPMAESGDSVAQFNVGNFYRNGWGVPQNYSIAFKWYRRSALMGYAPAKNSLGTMYRNGLGVTKNYIEALKWYTESADAGNISAMINQARMYQFGWGIIVDTARANHLYEQALYKKTSSIEDQEAKQEAVVQLATLRSVSVEAIRNSLPKDALELPNNNQLTEKGKKTIVKIIKEPSSVNEVLPIVYRNLNVHALVIGNADYLGIGKLKNPINDSKLIAKKLREFDFKVSEVTNTSRSVLIAALQKFSASARNADLTIFFYAGHGVQVDGINYILPTDIDMSTDGSVTFDGIRLDHVVEQFLPGKTKLIFLDACRDNPFTRSGKRGISRGLAPINVAVGTLIAYAAKDGHVAYDGDGLNNSPFTKALVDEISNPVDIGLILRRVRAKVIEVTKGKQEPWEYGSLTGEDLVLSRMKHRSN